MESSLTTYNCAIDPCGEILENIRNSLYKCTDNQQLYTISKTVALHECENIEQYKKSLHATKTQIVFKKDVIQENTPYLIQYNARQRVLVIDS